MACKFYLLLAFFSLSLSVAAQHVAWGHNLGLQHNHFISAIATREDGHSVVAINSRKSTMAVTGLYMGDLVIQKKDSTGSMIWQKNFPANAIIMSLKIDGQGNIIMTGGYRETLAMGSYVFTSAASAHSIFLAKLDTAGNVTWAHAEEASITSSYGANLAIGTNNEIYMTGVKNNQGLFSKYSAAGSLLWTKTAYGVTTYSSIVVDDNDEIYVTGSCESYAVFDTLTFTMPTGSYLFFLAKYNAQQKAQWVDVQLYNTADTRDALQLKQDQLYWLHQRKVNASAPTTITLQKFNKQGTMVGESSPFNILNLLLHKHMSNRFVITPQNDMVISFAATDTARIMVLDSTLNHKNEYRFVSKSIGAPFLAGFHNKIIAGAHFSGSALPLDTLVINNANTPVTQNDNFLAAFSIYNTGSPMPVSLISFTAIAKQDKVMLNWSTSSELTNTGFGIERNTGGEWKNIGFVKSEGNSMETRHYHYTDDSPAAGISQYRLKIIDADGSCRFSQVVFVRTNETGVTGLSLYPNPVKDRAIITYTLAAAVDVQVHVYDAKAKKVKTIMQPGSNAGNHSLSIDMSDLPAGVYTVQLLAGKQVHSQRVIRIF